MSKLLATMFLSSLLFSMGASAMNYDQCVQHKGCEAKKGKAKARCEEECDGGSQCIGQNGKKIKNCSRDAKAPVNESNDGAHSGEE